MKKTDFANATKDYFSNYLPNARGLSQNTIDSYRDTLKLLLKYFSECPKIEAEKIQIAHLTLENISGFLEWLETNRHVGISTRNQRQAALQAFVKYLRYRYPEYLSNYYDILSMKAKKKPKPTIPYLTADELKSLLAQPDLKTSAGRRNLVLLSVLYDTGARVQELCDLTTDDIYLQHPARLIITGKGGKSRQVPIIGDTRKILKQYIDEFHKSTRRGSPMPLFYNKYGTALSRSGVAYILKKYAATAELSFDYNSLTPHVLRHTKAMHMLQAGVKLIYIRDFLGHVDIKTTETYARADAEMKRKVFEKTVPNYTPNEPMPWDENEDLLGWLENLGKPLK